MKFINLDLELVLIICKYLSSIDCKNLILTNKKFTHELVLKSIKRQFTEIQINKDGTKLWLINNKLHREDSPAIEWLNIDKEWYINNILYREDGPAVETKAWYINNKLHREDGPAIELSDGTKQWFIKGKRHREDGPAIEYPSGTKKWYINGYLHREDGPAIEYASGTKEWYINGKYLTEEKFNNWLKFNVVAQSDPFVGT